MPDPSPDTPSVCPACGSTQPAAPHTGRWWRLDDGTIDDTRHGRCPNEWHASPAAPGSSSPDTAADDWMVELKRRTVVGLLDEKG